MLDRSSEFQQLALEVRPGQSKRTATTTSSIKTVDKEDFNLPPVPSDIESSIAKSAPLDDFLSQLDSIQSGFDKINRLMNEIDALHRHTLASVDAEEASRFSKKIEASSTLAASEAQNIRRLLKSIDQDTKDKTTSLSPSDLRLRTSKHNLWCKKFMGQMEQFEKMQTTYRNKYRAHLERQYLLIKPDATRPELDELGSDHSNQLMNQQIFKMANKAQAQKTLNEMKERHLEIQMIERSMSELHQMFLDVAFIVSQQGSTIDKVDEYVQTSLEATEQAAQEITNAVVKQKRAQRRRWIFSGIGLFILIVLIVIIVLSLTNRL